MRRAGFFYVVIVIVCSSVNYCCCQEIYKPGARSKAMGGYNVSLDDCWSAFGNQAGLATIGQLTVASSYESKFFIEDWSLRSFVLALPSLSSVFAVSGYQFGKNAYRQERLSIAYAKQLLPDLQVGIQFSYYGIFFSESNRMGQTMGVEGGLIYSPVNDFFIGFHFMNPYRVTIKTLSGKIDYPSLMNVGTHWLLSNSLLLGAGVEKEIEEDFHFKCGMEYRFLKNLWLRGGINGKPYCVSAGLGFGLRQLIVDLAYSYHVYLGNSPAVSLQYNF